MNILYHYKAWIRIRSLLSQRPKISTRAFGGASVTVGGFYEFMVPTREDGHSTDHFSAVGPPPALADFFGSLRQKWRDYTTDLYFNCSKRFWIDFHNASKQFLALTTKYVAENDELENIK